MNTFLERIKKPYVLLMIATLVYQGFEYFGFGIEQTAFQIAVDLFTFIALGVTVYKSDKNNLV